MKIKLLLFLFFIAFYFYGFSQDTRAFAITGQANKNFNWTDIRSIDMATGNADAVLFENGKTKFSFTDAETKKTVDQFKLQGNPATLKLNDFEGSSNKILLNNPSPTALMSAAIAYDKKHDKLFFASMHTGKLIWLDLRAGTETPSFYTIEKPLVKNEDFSDEAFNITRMGIGSDGNGYALTNDANHLISFTTGRKTIITDLGNLVDAETNNGISIHNKCSSWGGDIVADAFGKLYLFTATHSVFEIDIPSRIATYKGSVLNLPPAFSLNGAAVIDDDNIIVSSANTFDGFYKVSMKDFSATKLNTKGQIYNASDLASSNLLKQGQAVAGSATLPKLEVIGNKFISVYPNPVSDGQLKISFDNNVAGEYKIALTDLQGRMIENKTVYVKFPGQVENFKLQTKPVRGLYLIKITDSENQSIFSDKLIIN
ncbi:MAG: T9SS type A sorting domain-containing protein [Bacteroidota bacterium]|nr:T9SS type A sorting domain-containing protein [Bacteroidota bacterium]